MIKQLIELGNEGWYIIIYYNVRVPYIKEVREQLEDLGCPQYLIRQSIQIMSTGLNTGMTFSNDDYKTSFVCIGETTSTEQFVNTIVHEAKHVQSHICNYYKIDEDGEEAAYLIGYIVQRMYRMLQRFRIYG